MHRRLLLKLTSLVAIAIAIATTHAQAEETPSLTAVKSGMDAGACPLKHTSVKAEVSGFLSRVTVTQDFENPFDEKIEAIYTFPLPQSAAVDDLTMLIGNRTVKGTIMRSEDAQKAYANGKQLGKVAALLDQKRPNIFTQSVANIEPNQQIRIVISYVETLKYEDGSYEWSFPMVVAPRYNSQITDQLNYNERAGHDISIELAIDAGLPIESLNSETHETVIDRPNPTRALVRLKNLNTIPNKDFVLKYQVAGSTIEDAVLTHRSERGGFFTLILQPPQRVTAEDVMPKELVFVLDTSGSMEGFPIEKAKETMQLALDNLYPHDTFNLITFAGDTEILFDHPVPATPENLRKAKQFLAARKSDGGTEMMKAIKAALESSDSQRHVRIVCFMTDGHVGEDNEILEEVKKHKNARVFAMGFSQAPNRYLLDRMAEYGRGEVDYVLATGDTSAVDTVAVDTTAVATAAVARRFNERVRNPLLTDISIDWSTLPITEVYPKRIPDLFGAKPLILSGRYLSGARGTIVLKGKLAGQNFTRQIPIELPDREDSHDVLATLWARRKIDELMRVDGPPKPAETIEQVTELGLKFKLMTQFTSFVAIDEVVFTGGEEARPAVVPIFPVTSASISGLVTVSSESSEVLQSTTNSIGTNVKSQTMANLPVQSRSPHCTVSLAPGISYGNSGPAAVSSQISLSSNGQRPNANMFMVDGVSGNFGIVQGGQNPGPSAAGSTPALTASGGVNGLAQIDATREMDVKTTYTDPEYGRVPGAQINIKTSAGTNSLHGTLFYFFGNDALDANDWFANNRGLDQPPRRLNNFGGTFGGRLDRDKIFFFTSYEGLRLRKPMTGITDVPSSASRANAVPEVQQFLNAFPLPTGAARPDGFAEYAATFANAARHDAGRVVIDYAGLNWHLSGRYGFADSEAAARGAGGFSLNTTNRIGSRAHTLTGKLTGTLSPLMIVELSANYSRLKVAGSYDVDQFGNATIPAHLHESFSFDLNGRGANFLTGNEATNVQRQFNLVGAFSRVINQHYLKIGADYRRLSPILGMRTLEESVLFDGFNRAIPARVGTFARAESQRPVFNNVSLYAQDQWRPVSQFNMTYGVRWELNPPPSNDDRPLWQTTFANFAPRAGFAYQLFGQHDPRFLLRGGVGLYYDLGNERAGDVFVDSIPFVTGAAIFPGAATAGPPLIAFDQQLKLPRTIHWNLSLQRDLGYRQSLTASYVGAAGRRLLHTQTRFDQTPNFLRLTTNAGRSDYRALQVQFNRDVFGDFKTFVSYTWSRSLDNVSEDSARHILMTSENVRFDRGPSDFDVRHQLTGFISYDIPPLFAKNLGNKLSRNWSVDSVFNAHSARPVNVVYAFPTSFGFAYFRPDLIANQLLYILNRNVPGGREINPSAFTLPAGLEQGNLARNSVRGFPFYQIDLALRRSFKFTDEVRLLLQADAFNLFNHANFEDPIARDRVIGSVFSDTLTPNSTFGQSSALHGQSLSGNGAFGSFYNRGGARTLRLSLKLIF